MDLVAWVSPRSGLQLSWLCSSGLPSLRRRCRRLPHLQRALPPVGRLEASSPSWLRGGPRLPRLAHCRHVPASAFAPTCRRCAFSPPGCRCKLTHCPTDACPAVHHASTAAGGCNTAGACTHAAAGRSGTAILVSQPAERFQIVQLRQSVAQSSVARLRLGAAWRVVGSAGRPGTGPSASHGHAAADAPESLPGGHYMLPATLRAGMC